MEKNEKLTPANIRYLLTMKAFADAGKPIRNSYLADYLHYKKSSIHSMLKSLVSIGMIQKDDEGAETAMHYQQYYRKLDLMMQKCFPELDESEHAILALLSEIPERALQQMMQRD